MDELPYKREHLEWKPTIECPERFEVSNYGDIKYLEADYVSPTGKKLHQRAKIIWTEDMMACGGSHGKDYLKVKLPVETYSHRIAANAFIPNPENKPEVNHKDGNTYNNYCGCKEKDYQDSNLEWVTRKENMEHASQAGLINRNSELRKESAKRNREKIDYDAMRRPVLQLSTSGKLINRYKSLTEAAKHMNVGMTSIRAVAGRVGFHKTCGGYNWVYEDEYDPNCDYTVHIRQFSHTCKPVVQKTLDGTYVGEYSSIQEACKITGFSGSSYIGECCRGTREYYKGYLWEYKK